MSIVTYSSNVLKHTTSASKFKVFGEYVVCLQAATVRAWTAAATPGLRTASTVAAATSEWMR